jgi:hypothetical protein
MINKIWRNMCKEHCKIRKIVLCCTYQVITLYQIMLGVPINIIYWLQTDRPKHSILRSYINWRFFVVATLLIKPKQQHGKSKQKHWFVYKLYGFCCCAYQNKQKLKSSFFSYAWALVYSWESLLKNIWRHSCFNFWFTK